MNPLEINDRIAVILKSDAKTRQCYFLGYGIYEGKMPLDKQYCSKKVKKMNLGKVDSHRFKLDNGEIYFDIDVWFMSEERFNAAFVNDEYKAGWKVVNIDRKGRRRIK